MAIPSRDYDFVENYTWRLSTQKEDTIKILKSILTQIMNTIFINTKVELTPSSSDSSIKSDQNITNFQHYSDFYNINYSRRNIQI